MTLHTITNARRRLLAGLLLVGLWTCLADTRAHGFERTAVPPIDESFKDPDLQSYRNHLLAAVQRKDLDLVVAMASANISISFGGAIGRDELKRFLLAANEDNWSAVEQALRMGGGFGPSSEMTSFWAPYTWAHPFGEADEIDPFDMLIVIGDDVHVRIQPKTDAAVIDVYSHEVIHYDRSRQAEETQHWLPVQTAEGVQGWISARYVRHVLDLRLGFEKIDGQWRWNNVLMGD